MKKETVIRFGDFLSKRSNRNPIIAESFEEEDEINLDKNPYEMDDITIFNKDEEDNTYYQADDSKLYVENKNENTKNYYTLYKDISEKFSCDIMVEGAKTDDTITRLIIETEDWTLMFPGQIKNGKVVIPIKRLSLFDEGQTGKIKLEVIAEGTVFIPWEDTFKIKLSKKVSVKMNENKRQIEPTKPKTNITVNVKRK